MSQKAKMCKSPKSIVFPQQQPPLQQTDKIEYESLSTNCTIVGSNNLHLLKKPQIVTSMSPAYSNPSPGSAGGGYPPSPYSSPASLKSPSPQLQNLKPPTPQPNTFPVMQIIHNSHHPVITARPMHTAQQQNVIKLKPPLNILPKPSANPQQPPKPSVSPQIVLPSNQQTIMPTAQPLVLNQMPMLAPNVQFILRPQTAKLPAQVQQTPQGLILQPGGQQLFQLQTSPRSQPMVRMLPNGVGIPTTTYVTQMAPQNNIQQQQQPMPTVHATPKKKLQQKKKVKQKLDLANIMKLSGIGDDDDVQFESDASQSESEHNMHSQPATPQPSTPTMVQSQGQKDGKMGNIQISVPQAINTAGTPLVQVLNQSFPGGNQQAAPQANNIPFNSFITPNYTINNGLMVQRSGGFKLALGDDGRLVLQHDPTLNQDLQSQLLLQTIFGLNGGLVLQPSIDQQIHSQTVQTIQQQSVQTIQQQTVQSQTIQTVQHQIVQPQTMQSIQSQIQGQIQSLLQQQNLGSQSIAIQPQNITIQPQGMQGVIHSQPIAIHSQSQPITIQSQSQPITIQSAAQQPIAIQSQVNNQPSQIINLSQPNQIFTQSTNNSIASMLHNSHPSQNNHINTVNAVNSTQPSPTIVQPTFTQNTAAVPHQNQVNVSQGNQPVLKVQPFQKSQPPVQTVHPTHHHNSQPSSHQQPSHTSYVVNLTPDQLEHLKRNGQVTVNGQTIFMQRTNKTEEVKKTSPKIKPIKKASGKISTKEPKHVNNLDKTINNVVKDAAAKSSLVTALQAPPKVTQASVQTQPLPPLPTPLPPKIQPSAIIQPSVQASQIQPKVQAVQHKVQLAPSVISHVPCVPQETPNQEVERFLGQLIEETGVNSTASSGNVGNVPSVVSNVVNNVTSTSVTVNSVIQTNEVKPPPPPLQPTATTTTTPVAVQNNVITTPSVVQQPPAPTQRVHAIQLTPQMQQHLKSVQLQIQTLSARATPGNVEMQHALKVLFQEQQKILASGKVISPDKVYYHNNQLIVNNTPVASVKNDVNPPNRVIVSTAPNGAVKPTVTPPVTTSSQTPIKLPPVAAGTIESKEVAPKISVVPTASIITPVPTHILQTPVQQQPQPPPQRCLPLYTKAQLIEQQLNTDQNGAVKPDVHTPFKDKADACKRLIRYHCFDQPVLSEKDLSKADEIFELTAKHFIDKYGRMVDKYRFLLHKESQRHVQTSELMMLDRMFLAEEQQSLIKLRQEIGECNMEMQQSAMQPEPPQDMNNEEYDEWACIQRELGCLPASSDEKTSTVTTYTKPNSTVSTTVTTSTSQTVKRTSSDTRLETLKKFRVDKHCKKESGGETGNNRTKPTVSSNNVHCTMVQSNMQRAIFNNHTSASITRSNIGTCSSVTTSSRIVSNGSQQSNLTEQNVQHQHNMHGYNSMHLQNPMQRMHQMPGMHPMHPNMHVVHNSTTQQAVLQRGVHNMKHYSTQHIVQHITHTVHHTQQMQPGMHQNSIHHSSSIHSQNSYSSGNEELDNNDSIDEQVQSAIDSILNLQQNTSLELDETMQNMLS